MENRKLYEPKTGQILHPDCTWKDILDGLNSALREKGLTGRIEKKDIMWNGDSCVDADGRKWHLEDIRSIGEIAGGYTFVNVDTVTNVGGGSEKNQEDVLDYWIAEAYRTGRRFGDPLYWMPIGRGIHEISKGAISYYYVNNGKRFDIKTNENTVFGARSIGPRIRDRQYYGYIYGGEYLRFDAPGNIVIGVFGGAMGYSITDLKGWADIQETYATAKIEISEGDIWDAIQYTADDHEDKENLERGWNLAKSMAQAGFE